MCPEGKGICVAKVLGVFGIVIGLAFLFVAVDVLTDSKLSTAITGTVVEEEGEIDD